jgi:hypothetical protein
MAVHLCIVFNVIFIYISLVLKSNLLLDNKYNDYGELVIIFFEISSVAMISLSIPPWVDVRNNSYCTVFFRLTPHSLDCITAHSYPLG